jgi:hypothetical protein
MFMLCRSRGCPSFETYIQSKVELRRLAARACVPLCTVDGTEFEDTVSVDG